MLKHTIEDNPQFRVVDKTILVKQGGEEQEIRMQTYGNVNLAKASEGGNHRPRSRTLQRSLR